MVRVYYVVRVQGPVLGNTRSPSELAEERMQRADGFTPMSTARRERLAKFFDLTHAKAHIARIGTSHSDGFEIEEREEHERHQHESHRGGEGNRAAWEPMMHEVEVEVDGIEKVEVPMTPMGPGEAWGELVETTSDDS